MASRVRACLPPDDPVTWLTRDPVTELQQTDSWMLRVVDVQAAIAGRGFPAGVTISRPLNIVDAVLPANSGRWSLEVSGGVASFTRLGDASAARGLPRADSNALSIGARGFAALYAGVPVATLRLAGLAAGGDPTADDALSFAFGGTAFTTDNY